MTRNAAIARAERYFDAGTFRDDLARRVAFRTESQVPESRPQLEIYLEREIAPTFRRMGYATKILPNPVIHGGPFLIAMRREDDRLPTVLSYGHGDVICGLEGQWRQGLDPWTLTVEGERWYGRGTADNKSQHLINMIPDQLPDYLVDGETQLLALLPQAGIVVLACGARDREVAAFSQGLQEILAMARCRSRAR
jgi:hypothetical protein